VPAVVQGFDQHSSTYILDLRPEASPSRLRAATLASPASGATAARAHSCSPLPSSPASIVSTGTKTDHTAECFPEGAVVQYRSIALGGWVPAVVQGFDQHSSTYILDLHPAASPSRVRAAPPCSGPRPTEERGDEPIGDFAVNCGGRQGEHRKARSGRHWLCMPRTAISRYLQRL